MKEPIPDKHGMVCWNAVRCTHEYINEMKSVGFAWNEVGECYALTHEQLKEHNKFKGTALAPISFDVDHFHRAVHSPYGGDCK